MAVYCADPARLTEAAALAARLSLPLTETPAAQFDYWLTLTTERLELRECNAAAGPVYADFVAGPFGYRAVHGVGLRQPLARAIGLKAGFRPAVIDVTAGLGRDAFLLALLGCRVAMIERSPIVHALLADGLSRAQSTPAEHLQRLTLTCADGIAALENLVDASRPDTVYLDPMYPHRDQSALNRKEMRTLRALVGDDEDAPELLAMALKRARRRVAVKRPRLAPAIAAPTFQMNGRSTRYDIYIKHTSPNGG
ncbi:MAG: class I SAM-dependent methyltransferase [Gammaproteobacteria bacterium]